ncbi:MarR family winged helix-turn-helix transcriptional regulator [Streptomyces sp. NPDC001691]|uniref:MarR family winged helix-turn-helix transcriptional regulator n=1 Tax=unclassified Streptomyces TaxID=2593676 RepID=UPI000DEBCA64|nr:MarR family winged helix-turn-helix transcriptional regulator [Streptomyces sp. SDr-06]RCH68037.1 MarR family transcriptional regulator [Streptomyces sp. SDr-06]
MDTDTQPTPRTDDLTYSHDDAGLAAQPIGYWSWAAHIAVVTHIRAMLAELGLTQPQWWILNQAVDGRPRAEVVAVLQGYLDAGAPVIGDGIDELVARGLLTQDPTDFLELTYAGRELRETAAARQGETRDRIHAGITDEEYVRTLKVLQRMIHNVGGKAWHH